jgi:hypothetical protein
MRRSTGVLAVCICMVLGHAAGEPKGKELKAILDGVTLRGRALYAYDQAAWHGTDAFLALHPDKAGLARYICKQTPAGWVVTFGKWNEAHDKLLVKYEATESGGKFDAKKYDPPKEATEDLLGLEHALELAVSDFTPQNRPYNTAILPAPDGNLYVYIYPGQTKDTVWPLGGDVRYTISPDGKRIIERRQMHKTILDMEFTPDMKVVAGYHVHVLSDVPEDTDVLYVLTRRPSMPEYVGSTKNHMFSVNTDGSIVLTKK